MMLAEPSRTRIGMMRRYLSILIGCCPWLLMAHDPVTTKITWAQEISRIVQNRCQRCHSEGTPIALSTYTEARPWAKAIRDQVLSRRMPPWGAVRGAGEFLNDPSLTQPELERIVQWVEGGAPEGDPVYLPRARAVTAPATPLLRPAMRLSAGRPRTLATDRAFAGIRPDSPLEAIATLPGGRIEHLIWLRDFHSLTYVFRQPERFPKGTKLRVTRGSAVLFDLAPAPSIPPH